MESNSQILTQLSQISNTVTTTTVQSKPQLIQLAQKPLLVKTSKTWTLPPKPKPGRKSATPPVALAPAPSQTPASTTTAASAHHMEIKPKPRKQYKKKPTKEEARLESALKKVKDENQLLKQELSKLVSDLKSLQQQQQQHRSPSCASVVSNDSDLTSTEHHHHHRKRNLSEMLNQEAQFSSFINADSLSRDSFVEFDDDDIASVVSQTPSLMSHSSSVSSSYSSLSMDLSSSLSSIKEENSSSTVSKPLIKANAISKFSSCLSSPTFTPAPSSVKIDEFLTPLYNINEATKPPQQLQQLQPNVMQDDFEFQFLKDEISIIDAQDRQISSAGNEYFNWE